MKIFEIQILKSNESLFLAFTFIYNFKLCLLKVEKEIR